ncbi:DUF1492 domain-containing protein [Apilactobacillus sp. TMW 2.2459]|uniref:DUF1492 domain-containing protein n=1 Tax=Apilactobacillus xinyiensis TaxID=2841032 RepID=UPI00201071DF|nr:DUF1492 domain-containing protein [Apilactobacillus xinyiensis]MCL0312810.1 DUF1492 domain-containing protein [Apilactobacillus xinyiensis]
MELSAKIKADIQKYADKQGKQNTVLIIKNTMDELDLLLSDYLEDTHSKNLKKVKIIFKRYLQSLAIIKAGIPAVQNDGMITGKNKPNTEDDKMLRLMQARSYCKKVKKALNCIDNDYRVLLVDTYINKCKVEFVAIKLHYSRGTYFNRKNEAVSEFIKYFR